SDEKNVATQPNTPNKAPSSTTRPQPGVPAALSSNVLAAKLKTAKGGTMSLSDYSGKVMLVNLWATWCGPCRNEIPELVKTHKEFGPKGFEIIGLSTENPT